MHPSQYSYAELCFHVVDCCCDKNDGDYFYAVCLLCGERIKPFNNGKSNTNWAKWRGTVLSNHLVTNHKASPEQIKSCFTQISDLRMGRGKKRSASKSIGDFFVSRRRKEDSNSCNEALDNNPCVPSEEQKSSSEDSLCCSLGRGSGYQPISVINVSQVMRIITGNIPLTWEQRDGCSLFWKDILASYYCSDKYLSLISNNMKVAVKEFIKGFNSYTISFDCWSTINVAFKAVCFFAHVYTDGQYTSFLLDVKSIPDGSSDSLKKAYQEVADFYNLKDGVLFVGDSAAVNTAAFGKRKLLCFAHCLNTACSHLTSTTADRSTKIDYGLKYYERNIVSSYFGVAVAVCQLFRGSTFNELNEWFEEKKNTMEDTRDVKLAKPLKACETRWLEKLQYLEWIRQYGVICFRFLCCTGSRGINLKLFHNCLVQLPEVLFCLNTLNNALELLVTEKKCTVHLVLPILRMLTKFFEDNGQSFEGEIPRLIAKSFLHELKNGCLTISPDSQNLYKYATSCCTNMYHIDKDLFNECLEVSDSFFNKIWEMCDEHERNTFPCGYSTYKDYVRAYLSFRPRVIKESSVNPLRNALFYRKGGVNGYLLIGKLNASADYAQLESVMQMDEVTIEKKISDLQRKLKQSECKACPSTSSGQKRGRKSKRPELEEQLALLIEWKNNGLAVSDKMLDSDCFTSLKGDFSVLLSNTSDEMGYNLFDTPKTPYHSGIVNIPVKRYYEACLCLAATESDCERFFRILSLIVKKQYRVRMNGDRACSMAFLKYYATAIYYLFGNGKEDKRTITSLFMDV